MNKTKGYSILLIAGDYEIVQHVNHALSSARFSVQTAYNHREAFYMLNRENGNPAFQALIVDAAMIDRYSSDVTLLTLKKQIKTPIIAFALDRTAQTLAQSADVRFITSLDTAAIHRTLTSVLGIPADTDTGILSPKVDDPALARQIEEINTLFTLSRSLTEVLDLSEVLNRVVEAARHLTRAEEGMILLPEGDELYLRARVGMDADTARNFRIKTRDTLAGRVYSSGRPVLVGASGPQKVKTEYFVNSLLYVPIIQRGEMLGVLGVSNRTKEDLFTAHHQQLLLNLASFAAIAIHNARVHNESLERNRELELLVRASQALNASVSLSNALPNICRQLAVTLNVGHIRVYNFSRDHRSLNLQARYDNAWWPSGRGPLIDLERSIELRATLTEHANGGSPKWMFTDDADGESTTAAMLRRSGVSAVLVVPVFAEDQLLGVVRIFYIRRPNIPLPEATMASIRSAALQSVADLLNNSSAEVTDNLKSLLANVNKASGADWCDVSVPMQDASRLSVQVRYGTGMWLQQPRPVIYLNDKPDLREMMTTHTPLQYRITSTGSKPGATRLLQDSNSRTILCVPMAKQGETVGMVMFAAVGRDRIFTDAEIMLAKAVVSQAAIALENARLVHDLESSLEDLQNAQKRLVQTARLSAMGELASVVAHQMNNPLTTIIVDTELMLMDEPADSPRRSALEAIARTGKRAANVARRLLAIARPVDASATPDYIDVVDSLRGILSLLQAHFEHAKVTVKANLPSDPIPPVRAIKGRLDDIWLNLLMNAYDALYEKKDGEIGVHASYDAVKGEVTVVIADNGAGIPADIQEKIFSPFFTTKPIGEGTGLGLHISKEVVEDAGGTIRVESKPGEKTRFIVKLPVHRT
ncbi:MAG: GAF domain-containing protein [Chloroflexota bacterium]